MNHSLEFKGGLICSGFVFQLCFVLLVLGTPEARVADSATHKAEDFLRIANLSHLRINPAAGPGGALAVWCFVRGRS